MPWYSRDVSYASALAHLKAASEARDLDVHVNTSASGRDITVSMTTRKDAGRGYFQAFLWDAISIAPECAPEYERARRAGKGLFIVHLAQLSRSVRKQGFGTLGYEVLVEYALEQGAVIGPDRCRATGGTSRSAGRVWASLCRSGKYVCDGPFIVGRQKRR
jgi:hypothetical protein